MVSQHDRICDSLNIAQSQARFRYSRACVHVILALRGCQIGTAGNDDIALNISPLQYIKMQHIDHILTTEA